MIAMRDRIFEYLKKAGQPLSATEILLDVLQIRAPVGAGDKVLEGIVQGDCRFGFSDGLWAATENAEAPRWEAEFAILFIESADQGKRTRGAVQFPSGFLWTFDSADTARETDSGSIREMMMNLGKKSLLGWRDRDLGLFRSLLRARGLPGWDGEFLAFRTLAARVLNRPAGTLVPDDLASAVKIACPVESAPEAMARFFAGCLPLLLDLVPAEFREDIRTLRGWISAGRKNADFTRFGFGPEFLRDLPDSPGAYVMKDKTGTVIYVGKSRNLKRRVRSYFLSSGLESAKTRRIHEQLHSIEVRPAANEVEALLLEMRLIRKLRPAVNLQTKIHVRPNRHGRKNLLLIAGGGADCAAVVYFLKDGLLIGKQSVRLHRTPGAKLRNRIKATYFSKRQKIRIRDPWKIEIVARWLSRNRNRLNWVDVNEAGDYQNVISLLSDYLNDQEELRNKVYYR